MNERLHEPVFYTTPGSAWDAMYNDCAKATRSISCEQYILHNDYIGQRFLTLFIDKARQGLEVCLVLDGIGSRQVIDSPLIKILREAGGCVSFYNPMRWWNILTPWHWLPRNHTKLMLVDGETAFIGSACLSDGMREWRDLHIRVTGDVLESMNTDFKRLCSHLVLHTKSREKRYHIKSDLDVSLRFGSSGPRLRINPLYKELLQRIRQAHKSVYLVTPYFLPPRRLMVAMRRAAKRGVDVRVMSGEVTDVSFADCVSRSYLPWLLRNKISLLLYQKTVLHAKYAIIDGTWAMLGSTNLDYLSLIYNREANLMIRDAAIIKHLMDQFKSDTQNTVLADRAYWKNLSWSYKTIGFIGRLIKRFL